MIRLGLAVAFGALVVHFGVEMTGIDIPIQYTNWLGPWRQVAGLFVMAVGMVLLFWAIWAKQPEKSRNPAPQQQKQPQQGKGQPQPQGGKPGQQTPKAA
jgi:hypothetical protein